MTILTLTGWAQPDDALQNLVPGSIAFPYASMGGPDAAFRELGKTNPDLLVGWSLGGALALQAVAEGRVSPRLLVLIGAPFQFVADEAFKTAMERPVFELFRQNYTQDPVKTSAKFNKLICMNDTRSAGILQILSNNKEAENSLKWAVWLDFLSHYSCKKLDFSRFPSILLLHGRGDVIVEVAQTQQFETVLHRVRTETWDGCGHAPHYHAPDKASSLIYEVMNATI